MMRFAREILALLLVSALLLATGAWAEGGHWLGLSDRVSDDHPAGCHAIDGGSLAGSQAPHSPQPAPGRHECCLTGHDVATMQSSYDLPPLATTHRVTVQVAPELSLHFLGGQSVSMFRSVDPPGMTSLRI
jgi:hypothetical protein